MREMRYTHLYYNKSRWFAQEVGLFSKIVQLPVNDIQLENLTPDLSETSFVGLNPLFDSRIQIEIPKPLFSKTSASLVKLKEGVLYSFCL